MITTRRLAAPMLLLVSCVVVITGCGAGSSTATTASVTAPPSGPTLTPTITPLPTVGLGPLTCTALAAPPFPMITYSPADAQGKFVDGQLQGTMGFKVDGTFNRAGTRGCYRIDGQRITITDQVNTFNACVLVKQVGLYQWAYDGTVLSFKLVNDPCDTRATSLTQYQWKFMP